VSSYTSVSGFTNAIKKYPAKIEKATIDSVKEAALFTKTTTLGMLRAASGGDLVLSGVGKKGAKIGVNYKVTGKTAIVAAYGPVPLIEGPTKGHDIPKVRKRGQRKSNILIINGNVITGPVHHPGTKGKHPWRKGVELARPGIDRILRTRFLRLG
jgi:hypothetical protein